MYSFTGQAAISQKLNDTYDGTLCLAEFVKSCRSEVLFIALSCLDGQIFWFNSLTAYTYPLVQGTLSVFTVKSALSVSFFIFCVCSCSSVNEIRILLTLHPLSWSSSDVSMAYETNYGLCTSVANSE